MQEVKLLLIYSIRSIIQRNKINTKTLEIFSILNYNKYNVRNNKG